MANEIKYLSYEGLEYFWKNKLKPEIEDDEEVIASALVDLNTRLSTHTHSYVASAGYAATAAYSLKADTSVTAGYSVTAARSVTAGYSVTAAHSVTAARSITAGYSVTAARSVTAGYSVTSARSVTAGYATTAEGILSIAPVTTDTDLNNLPVANNLRFSQVASLPKIGLSNSDGFVLTGCWSTITYATQLALDDSGYNIAFRYKNTTWSNWKNLAFADGTSATGTWNISISATAAHSVTAGYSVTAARSVTAGYSVTSARSVTAGYSVTAARSVTAGYSATAARATYSASAGYVYRVNINAGSSSMWYPMVFTSTKTATTGALLYIDSNTDTSSTATGIRYNPSSNSCYCSGGFYEASDERLKNFGDDIEVDLDKLSILSKKYFTWKDDKSNMQHIGISAQELQELYPEIVNVINEEGHLSVSYDKLSVVALKGIDILNDKVKSLEERLNKLEEKLNIAQ